MKNYNGIINISEPENDYSIYIMYSSNSLDKSIYIGVTRDYKQRVYKHSIDRTRKNYCFRPLYKWLNEIIDEQERNIIFEVIEKELTEKNAFEKEIMYIQEYKNNGYNVLNVSEGGKGNKGHIPWNKGKKNHLTKEQKNLLSNSHKGKVSGNKDKNHTQQTKELISLRIKERKEKNWHNPRKKKVYKYNNDNSLIIEYSCLEEAGINENVSPTSIGEWCRGKKKPRNGFIYSYNLN